MFFLAPLQLFWLALAIIPLVLFLVFRRPKTQEISTLLFIKQLSRKPQESPWWRQLKRWLALLLSLLVLMLATFYLAGLSRGAPGQDLAQLIWVLDTSASMTTREPNGSTRLDRALEILRGHSESIPEGVPVTILAYDQEVRVIHPPGYQRSAWIRALSRLRPRPLASRPEWVPKQVIDLAGLTRPLEIWHFSDRPWNLSTADLPPDVTLREWNLRSSDGFNAGITAVDFLPAALSAGEGTVFTQVLAQGKSDLPVRLSLKVNDAFVALREIDTRQATEGLWVSFPVRIKEGALIELNLEAAEDRMSWDNQAWLRVGAMRPPVVLWVAEHRDVFMRIALQSFGSQIRVLLAGPGDSIPPGVDVVIRDGVAPGPIPHPRELWINPPPDQTPGLSAVPASPPALAPRAVREGDPLLNGLAVGRFAPFRTSWARPDSGFMPVLEDGLGALIGIKEDEGRTVMVWTFDPARSGPFRLTASFPLLLGNTLMHLAGTGRDMVRVERTGQLIRADGERATWADGTQRELLGGWLTLDHLGPWQAGNTAGAASLLSREETQLAAGAVPGSAEAVASPTWTQSFALPGTGLILLLSLLTLLVLESWLFHRRAVF